MNVTTLGIIWRLLLTWSLIGASALSSSTTTTTTSISNSQDAISPSRRQQRQPIPITVLSGFLGSGKTTLLQHMLQHGKRIAVIVNDVASVNIDSKLVKGAFDVASSPVLELQNGCACCSLSDELLATVSELILLSDLRQEEDSFEHIVIELSGVADPKSIRAKFQEAVLYDMPLMERVRLDTLVTVIDCSVFLQRLRSDKIANPMETPELFYREGEAPPPPPSEATIADNPSEWDGLPPGLLEALGVGSRTSNSNNNNAVAELLVGQTETADILLLNKVDLVTPADDDNDDNGSTASNQSLRRIEQICRALNPRATILSCQFGQVPLDQILAVAGGNGVVEAGVVDDHRDAVEAATVASSSMMTTETNSVHQTNAIERDHDSDAHHHHHDDIAACHDPDCTDASHSHAHHDHHTTTQAVCNDPDCTDAPTHAHSHDHHHSATTDACTNPDCTDPSHSHDHHHPKESFTTTAADAACTDPACTDPTHNHNHDDQHHPNVSHQHAGIGSFVYRARRPFHPQRLVAFLRHMPIVRGLPLSDADTETPTTTTTTIDNNNKDPASSSSAKMTIQISPLVEQALRELLRSKGFTWCADSDIAALYWSHAGTSFEMQCLGRWWATLPREQWPSDAIPIILADFDNDEQHHDGENDAKAPTVSSSVGDRRQEIVFIGQELGRRDWQTEICKTLDQCLLTDEEWSTYQELKRDEKALKSRFANPLPSRMLTY